LTKPQVDISEDVFHRQMTAQSELSILVGMDTLAYLVTNAQRKVQLLRTYAIPTENGGLTDILEQDEFLKLPYQQVRAAVVSPIFTLVPERLYNPVERRTYLQEIAPLTYETDVRMDELSALQARLVYGAPNKTLDAITKQLPNAKISHATTALIAGLLARPNAPTSPVLYLQIYDGWLVAIVLEGKNLLFANTFHYLAAKDFLYYVLLIFDQYKLTPEETPVYISGQLYENSEIYPLLQRYVRSLRFLPAPDFLQLGTKLQQQPTYFYFNLFGMVKL